MGERVYSPGCALLLYKPHLAERMLAFLNRNEQVAQHRTCCQNDPGLPEGTVILNTCAGCDRRFRSLYEGISTVSVWEELAESDFPFPDYGGAEMTIHDPCPTRTETRVHDAVRALAERMNIRVIEPPHTRTEGFCCGDSFWPKFPAEHIKGKMRLRAGEMPRENVIVYCVSCVKSMHIGGKTPRYLVDLLFGEPTEIGVFEPDEWHGLLEKFIDDQGL